MPSQPKKFETIEEIRKDLGERLKYEFRRRGMTPEEASEQFGLPLDTIMGYLAGKRKIIIKEITRMCEEMGVNPVRLLFSLDYPRTNLIFCSHGRFESLGKLYDSIR